MNLLIDKGIELARTTPFEEPARFTTASEELIRGFYEALLAEGDCAVDVGVHYGRHMFPLCARVGAAGLVYAIEANVERYAALLKQIRDRELANVHLLHIAAADTEGFRDFFINRTNSGRSGLRENKATPDDVLEKGRVFAAPLSSILPKSRPPRFMKIDIEGAEFPALVGALKVIQSAAPVIVFEGSLFESADLFGYSRERVREFIRTLGYRIFDLFGNEIDLEGWGGGVGWNFIAAKANDAVREQISHALAASWARLLASSEN